MDNYGNIYQLPEELPQAKQAKSPLFEIPSHLVEELQGLSRAERRAWLKNHIKELKKLTRKQLVMKGKESQP